MTRGFRVPFPWTGLSPLDGAHGDPSGLLGPSLSCVVGGCLGLSCCPQGTFWMPWLQRDPQDRPCLALLRWRPAVDFCGAHTACWQTGWVDAQLGTCSVAAQALGRAAMSSEQPREGCHRWPETRQAPI